MKKIFLLLLPLWLFCEPRPSAQDLDACYQRNVASQFDYKGLTAVALTRHLAAVIAEANKTLAPTEYVKFDPYLKLYMIELDTTEVAPHLDDETAIGNDVWVNVLEKNATQIGHIKEFAQNLGELDTLSFYSDKKGALLCDCCKMLGIAIGENKFVGNRYLRNFVAHKDVYYGDIGVSFNDINGTFAIKSVYPFGPGSKLVAGDKILTLNAVVPRSLREINEAVLFAKVGDTLRFEVDRNGKKQLIHVRMPSAMNSATVGSRDAMNSGENNSSVATLYSEVNSGVNSDNNKTKTAKSKKKSTAKAAPDVLSSYGLSVGSDMVVRSASKQAAKAGFAPGDKIMQVGKIKVSSPSDLRRALGNYRLNHVLVSRDDFQFFIRLRR